MWVTIFCHWKSFVLFFQPTMYNIYFLFQQYLYYSHSYMFRYICIIFRELQSCTSLKLRSFYFFFNFIKNYHFKIFMWLLLIKCSLYIWFLKYKLSVVYLHERLCSLVVGVSGYRYRGLGFDSRRYQIFWVVVGLERGPLSLVRSTEELLE